MKRLLRPDRTAGQDIRLTDRSPQGADRPLPWLGRLAPRAQAEGEPLLLPFLPTAYEKPAHLLDPAPEELPGVWAPVIGFLHGETKTDLRQGLLC